MQFHNRNYKSFFVFLLLVVPFSTFAHTINYVLERAPVNDVVWFYFKMGVQHIIPLGYDHILFVISLCLLNTKIRTILWQATAFTVAHTITLALSMKGVVKLPADIVEPLIALSIMFVAIENILLNELKAWRIVIVFMFGLVHGMGFASALNEIGLPRNKFFTSIFSFNVGVEVGQVTIIALVFLLIIIPFGKKPWYKKSIVYPLSGLIASIAGYWTIERIFFT